MNKSLKSFQRTGSIQLSLIQMKQPVVRENLLSHRTMANHLLLSFSMDWKEITVHVLDQSYLLIQCQKLPFRTHVPTAHGVGMEASWKNTSKVYRHKGAEEEIGAEGISGHDEKSCRSRPMETSGLAPELKKWRGAKPNTTGATQLTLAKFLQSTLLVHI